MEVVLFLVIGYFFTVNIASNLYENQGNAFVGNVWVNWFEISYCLFVINTIVMGVFLFREVSTDVNGRIFRYFKKK